jgi:hypothetical protein
MHYLKLILTFGFLLSYINLALAKETPNDFSYKGKSIDPNCILESYNVKAIDLKSCSNPKYNKTSDCHLDNGIIGYNYTLDNGAPGSLSYKYLGKINDMHVVQAFMIGGVTSRLNYINYFHIDKDKLLVIKKGPSGDRSNGGISNARIAANILSYDLALTKFNQARPILEAKNLPDCAICQFALVHYKNDKIESISLNDVILEQHNPYADCFNKMHQKLIDNKQLTFSEKQAADFIEEFRSKCT